MSNTVVKVVLRCMAGAIFALSIHASTLAAHPIPAQVYACLKQAAAKHRVPLPLLLSIAEVESQFNPMAVGRAGLGTDYGLLQINSTWLPTLAKHRIGVKELFNPCVNADVGAWILAQNISTLGYNWNAVGAYNAVSKDKRAVYASRVSAKLPKYLAVSTTPVQTQTASISEMSVWEALQ